MKTYLIGVIEVNPKQILDEGVRKELIKLIFKVFDENLQFKSGNIVDFEQKLNQLKEWVIERDDDNVYRSQPYL